VLTFEVFVACHVTPPSRKIRRTVSRLIGGRILAVIRKSRSLDNNQVDKGSAKKSGRARRS
jgi:hypothetical protein